MRPRFLRAILVMGLLASSTARGHPHSAAETQADMNAAAQADLNVVEARMDSVLAELTKRGAGHSKALAKLNASQSAWRTYRQAMVDASHPASKVEPSETPMCRAWIAERLTKRRIEELLELLHPIEADACHSAWPW